MRKFKKIEENILNLSFEVDTFEEEEGGDDIESSDSDNDDGDVGEFDPELEAKTKTLADQWQCSWAAGAVPGACLHKPRPPRRGPGAGRGPRRLDGDDHDEPRRNVMPSSTPTQ